MWSPWKLPSNWQEPREVVSSESEKSIRRVAVTTRKTKVMAVMKRILISSVLADTVIRARERNGFEHLRVMAGQ